MNDKNDQEKEIEKIKKRYLNNLEDGWFYDFRELEYNWANIEQEGVKQYQIDQLLIFIVKLKQLFKENNVGFVYPSIIPEDGHFALEWDPQEPNLYFYMGMTLCFPDKMDQILVCVSLSNMEDYVQWMSINDMDNRFLIYLKENADENIIDWLNESMKIEKDDELKMVLSVCKD